MPKKCKIAAENNDSLQFIKMDIDFHKSIVQATHNKMFIELYEHITDSLQNSVDKVMEIKILQDLRVKFIIVYLRQLKQEIHN